MEKRPIVWDEICPILIMTTNFLQTDNLVVLLESKHDLEKYQKIIERLNLTKRNGRQFSLTSKNTFYYDKLLSDCGFYMNSRGKIWHPDVGGRVPNDFEEMTADNSKGKAYEFVEKFSDYFLKNPYKDKLVFGIVDKDLGHKNIITNDNFAKTEYRDIEATLIHEYLVSEDDVYKSYRALRLAVEQGLLEQSSFELNCRDRRISSISRFLWDKDKWKSIDKKYRKENIQQLFGNSLYDIDIEKYLENQKSCRNDYFINDLKETYVRKKIDGLEDECEWWMDESGCSDGFPETACSLINGHMYFDALRCCKNIEEETDNELFNNWLDDPFININKIALVDPIKTFLEFLRNKGIIED